MDVALIDGANDVVQIVERVQPVARTELLGRSGQVQGVEELRRCQARERRGEVQWKRARPVRNGMSMLQSNRCSFDRGFQPGSRRRQLLAFEMTPQTMRLPEFPAGSVMSSSNFS